jgi:hypothetical protein
MNEEWRGGYGKGCLLAILAMMVGTAVCGSGVYYAVEHNCRVNAETWLVDYPGAELVREEHTFMRRFGIGETTRILYTPDDRITVLGWYSEHEIALGEQGHSRSNTMADLSWTFRPTDNGGTQINLYSSCNPEMALW